MSRSLEDIRTKLDINGGPYRFYLDKSVYLLYDYNITQPWCSWNPSGGGGGSCAASGLLYIYPSMNTIIKNVTS